MAEVNLLPPLQTQDLIRNSVHAALWGLVIPSRPKYLTPGLLLTLFIKLFNHLKKVLKLFWLSKCGLLSQNALQAEGAFNERGTP